MCLFAPAPYYKLNKGFFIGFLFKPLGGCSPPHGFNKNALEKYPLFITCLYLHDSYIPKFDFMNYAFAKLVVAWLYVLNRL